LAVRTCTAATGWKTGQGDDIHFDPYKLTPAYGKIERSDGKSAGEISLGEKETEQRKDDF
jgi:hypothetical protein